MLIWNIKNKIYWNLKFKLIAEKPEEKDIKSDSNAKSVKEQNDLPVSESDTDKKVSIFNSDTDGENMHGGRTLVLWNFSIFQLLLFIKNGKSCQNWFWPLVFNSK